MNPKHNPETLHPAPLREELVSPEERPDLANTRGLADYVEELWRWKFIIVIACVLGTLFMAGLTIMKPNIYRSSSTLLVKAPRQGVDMESVAGINTGNLYRFSPVQAAITLLRSNDLCRRVVNKPGMAELLLIPNAPSQNDTVLRSRSFPRGLFIPFIHDMWRANAKVAREELPIMAADKKNRLAIKALKRGLDFDPSIDSASIYITFRSDDSKKARDILKCFIREGLKYYIECNSAGSALTFINEQISEAEGKYLNANRTMDEFLQKHGIGDYKTRKTLLTQDYEELEQTIRKDEAEINQLKSHQKGLNAKLEQMDNQKRIPGPVEKTMVPNPEYTSLQNHILTLGARIQEERDTAEKERLSTILDKYKKDLEKTPRLHEQEMKTFITNPQYTNLLDDLLQAESRLGKLQHELSDKKEDSRKIKKSLTQLQALQPEWLKYSSTAEHAQAYLNNLKSRISKLKASKALEDQGVSSLRAIDMEELAELIPEKEGPERAKFILMGFFGALGSICSLIMLLLRMSTRITRGSQIEKILGLEVPAAIPKLSPGNIKRFLRARALGKE